MVEKLNILSLAQNTTIDQEDIYDNISKYYKDMKDDLDKLSYYKTTLELYHSQTKNNDISKILK